MFFPIPLVLVLLRLEVEAWHYYVFGAAYVGFSALLYRLDSQASQKCDEALKAAEEAERALAVSADPRGRVAG